MPSHLSLFDLFLLQNQNAPEQNKREIERHLQSCSTCRDYATVHVSFLQNLKRTNSSCASSSSKAEKDCLSCSQVGKFVLNELRESERKDVEKHCALCEPCRELLAEVFRAITLPLRESEQEYVTDNPPASMEIQLRQILDLTEPQPVGVWKNIDKRSLWMPVPLFRPAIGLATLLLIFVVGKWWAWPEFCYQSLVQKSMEKMSLDYPVYYLGDVRPSGDYHTTDVKEVMRTRRPVASTESIEKMMRLALAYKKDGAQARQILAQFYLMEEAYTQADSMLRLLEAAASQGASVRNDRGLWYYAQNQYQAAALAFEQAYDWDPKLDAALYNLAIVQQKLGQIDAAHATWEEYLQLNVAKEWHNAAKAQLQQLENP